MRMRTAQLALAALALAGCSSGDSPGQSTSGGVVVTPGGGGTGGTGTAGAAGAMTGGSAGVGVAGFPSGGGAGGSSGGATGGGGEATGGTGGAAASAGSGGASTAGAGGSVGGSPAGGAGQGGGADCKTMCLGVECGPIPDGCGTTLDCGDCGGAPGTTCIKMANPMWQTRVHNGVAAAIAGHPEYFDTADTMGGSVKVLDIAGYRAAVVAFVDGKGATCIPDPNDTAEIRVKGTTDAAENYRLYTSAGYTSYTYTSTCSPAGF